jgi:hypothetical protein
MLRDDWMFATIETIRAAVETDVLKQPGKIAKLPNALGGDRGQWPSLAAAAEHKDGFFEILWSKAHFLMLPKPIVTFMKYSDRVSISEQAPDRPQAKGETHCGRLPDPQGNMILGASMRIPGAGKSLARVGYRLGGADTEPLDPFDPDECAILGTIYHEMTHAWLCLREFSDSDIQKLHEAGGIAYKHSVGTNETPFDQDIAFTEAAGEYVEDRILRWCTALYGMAKVLQDPKTFRWKLTSHPTIAEEYDRPLGMFGIVGGEEIASPKLSDAACQPLRAAIDKKLLDGLPLTQRFDDTPLAVLRDAVLGH